MKIRNFCIIAHIDHGKSTLADRLLEVTGTIEQRQMREQVLDSMDLERERGITIKLQPVRMNWRGFVLNLIDTPGHVDFQYEVSRSLQAVEGAILLVDATQGVQAQTISNLYLAIEQGLTIIPVINKIDLPAADVAGVTDELRQLLGESADTVLAVSAKTGAGVEQVLEAVVARVPAPFLPADKKQEKPLQALIFDSVYDDYKGVVAYVRVVSGRVKKSEQILFRGTGVSDRAVEVGVFLPAMTACNELRAGEIGYIATGLKEIQQARIGDTIALAKGSSVPVLPGFRVPQPKVFAGLYPERGEAFPQLREALGKLQLNDASLTVQQEQSEALGQGFRCGFLGLLHLDIVQERLRREYDLSLVVTTPSVLYRVTVTDGAELDVHTPAGFPDPSRVVKVAEQVVAAEIITPVNYLGEVFALMRNHEAKLVRQTHLGSVADGQEAVRTPRTLLEYRMPLRELVVDLYDQLKSVTSGYGSLSYELTDWQEADVVKLGILVNHQAVEALSVIVPRAKAEQAGRRIVGKLREVIPRQLFAVPLQAVVGGKILARETLPAQRKDVTGHLYGGDITRKRKLLDKQKKGKRRLAGRGSVIIPPEAYLAVLKRS